jgi:hypothetical protein
VAALRGFRRLVELPPRIPESKLEDMRTTAKSRAQGHLDDLLRRDALQDLRHQIHLVQGEPRLLIPKLAAKERIDLIVMGTFCRTGIPGFLIGNTAEHILQNVDCSVLAVKPEGFVTPSRCDGSASEAQKSQVSGVHDEEERALPAIDRIGPTDGHRQEQESTRDDDHDQIGVAHEVEWKRANQGADTEHPKEIEDVRADDVADGDVGLTAVRGGRQGRELRRRRPDRDDGQAKAAARDSYSRAN